jgi:predicted amidohydrolase YtcJ
MASFGHFLQALDLRSVGSIKEMQRRLQDYAEENPEKRWILGGRWDQERFAEKRYPTRWDLDAAIIDKPVFLTRVCGHIGIVNTKALQLAGLTKDSIVDGGRADLNEETGELSGILRENALEHVWKAIPKPTSRELEKACILACEKAVEAGLTCVHWILGSPEEMRIIQKLLSKGKLRLRVYLGIPVEFMDELTRLGLVTGFGNDMVKIGFVKILADGSLGGHTAALKKPYSDKPGTRGMILYSQKELDQYIMKAHKARLQLAVHAIGDKTIEIVLKSFEKATGKHPLENRRHRIEHCSVLNPKLIRKMRNLGLIASVQPHFVASDFWVANRVGKTRARWVYPFKTLMHQDLVVSSGSDCPVEPISPILGIWAAVARKSFPEEALTIEEALKTYTVNAVFASFDESKRGTIETGKFADFTILSDDLLSSAPEDIRRNQVEMTIVDEKIVYARRNIEDEHE